MKTKSIRISFLYFMLRVSMSSVLCDFICFHESNALYIATAHIKHLPRYRLQ